jgi:hypothetical protein
MYRGLALVFAFIELAPVADLVHDHGPGFHVEADAAI